MRAVVFIAASLLTTACYAQSSSDTPVDPAFEAMFGVGGEVNWFNFSVTNGFATVIDDGPFNFIRQPDDGFDFDGVGAGGNMHLVAPLNDGPLGSNVLHFAFGGNFADDDEGDTITLSGAEYLDVFAINGTGARGGANGVTIDTDANVDFSRFYLMPTIGWGQGMVSLNVGPLLELKSYQLDVNSTIGGAPYESLDEDTRVFSVGPVFALMTKMPMGSHLQAFLGGQAAPLWSSGSLDAHQDLGGGGLLFDQDDETDDFAFMGRAVGGVSVAAGRFTGTLYGTGEWRNDVYEIVNPRSAPGLNALTNFDASHLDQTDLWGVSVGVKGSIKLGGGQP